MLKYSSFRFDRGRKYCEGGLIMGPKYSEQEKHRPLKRMMMTLTAENAPRKILVIDNSPIAMMYQIHFVCFVDLKMKIVFVWSTKTSFGMCSNIVRNTEIPLPWKLSQYIFDRMVVKEFLGSKPQLPRTSQRQHKTGQLCPSWIQINEKRSCLKFSFGFILSEIWNWVSD